MWTRPNLRICRGLVSIVFAMSIGYLFIAVDPCQRLHESEDRESAGGENEEDDAVRLQSGPGRGPSTMREHQ